MLFVHGINRDCYTSAHNAKEQANELVPTIARFVNTCSAKQIRLAPEKCMNDYYVIFTMIEYVHCAYCEMTMDFQFTVVAVCRRLKDQVMLLRSPIRGVAPLLTAIRKLQSSSEHLTAIHPDFLLLCLSAKCYKSGLSILEDDIYDVDHLEDLLLYGYYGCVSYLINELYLYC